MIIDGLTHITADGSWFGTRHDAGLDRLLLEMEKGGVEKALLVGNPLLNDNPLVLETCRNRPGQFIPIAAITTEDTKSGRDFL
ncbi:MAG: hypothetical protein GY757_59155, partial [bacterium]|nr:hypothetical protein [bacterium]